MLISPRLHYILFAIISILMLLIASYTDLKRREIPNELVVAGMVSGLILGYISNGLQVLNIHFSVY